VRPLDGETRLAARQNVEFRPDGRDFGLQAAKSRGFGGLFRPSLDSDFDLLIDAKNVHILRPSGFEFAGKLQQAILDAVPGNVAAIQAELIFIEFDGIEQYAAKHPRAARYLASIRGHEEMKNIDKAALKKLCKSTGVDVSESKGKVIIADGHEMAFLQVLDRRRYQLELVKDKPEKFVAASRKPIK
jgi:hypothetical protein